jgi:type II protein arginine methyltransferase
MVDATESVALAVKLFRAGRLEDADRMCLAALAENPRSHEALHLSGIIRRQRGDHEGAVRQFDQAIAIEPRIAAYHNNRAEVLRALARYDEAIAGYRRALALRPDFAEALNNLGAVLRDLGRLNEALACFEQALPLQPGFALAHMNLGTTLQRLGRIDEAMACFDKALGLKPDLAAAHMHRGQILEAKGQPEAAMEAYRRAVALRADLATAHLLLGNLQHRAGQPTQALQSYRAAIAADPGFLEAHKNLGVVVDQLVPAWHFPMVRDTARNDAYEAALRRAVQPHHLVLDIGAGSGLLSMIAARAGADLPRKAEVLVSEVLASDLLSEGVLDVVQDAKARLLAPDAIVIPQAVSVRGMLVGGAAVETLVNVGTVSGFDLSPMNEFRPRRMYLSAGFSGFEAMSEPVELFDFDFRAAAGHPAAKRVLSIEVTRGGLCFGVIQWIRLQLYQDIAYENRPGAGQGPTSWQPILHTFVDPLRVAPGEIVQITAWHNREHPVIMPVPRRLPGPGA